MHYGAAKRSILASHFRDSLAVAGQIA